MSQPVIKLTTQNILEIIEDAKNAELCRDWELSRQLLSPLWGGFESEPELPAELPDILRAEILRLCGFNLSCVGRAKNKIKYQERGRNLLTRAIEIFESENFNHKAAEAKVMLSLCYWYEGAYEESNLILEQTESEYKNNQLHPVYIQICCNRLMILYKLQQMTEAFELIEKLRIPMEFCKDARLQTMYHNQAGIVFDVSGKTDKAFFHYQNAISYSIKAKNRRFEAQNLNNLALLCKQIGDFNSAHKHVDTAFEIYEELDENGWLAHVLDTKALIYLAERNFALAEKYINKAIDIFRGGEDFMGLSDALFNRAKIYLKINLRTEALIDFAEVMKISTLRTGESAAVRYAAEFAKLIYALTGTDYYTEEKTFRKKLVRDALQMNELQVVQAAKSLGMSHQNLSKIMRFQFPEIYDELGIKYRNRTARAKQKTVRLKTIYNEKQDKKIEILAINHNEIILPDSIKMQFEGKFFSFILSGKQLPELKTNDNVIVLATEVEEANHQTVIAQNRESREFVLLKLGYDKFMEVFYVVSEDSEELLSIDDFNIYGKIVAYHSLKKEESGALKFIPYPK